MSSDAQVLARLQQELPALYEHGLEHFKPAWSAVVGAVAGSPSVIVDLASGPGEPACSLAQAYPQAEVVASDCDEAMLMQARARSFRLGLGGRVSMHPIDLRDIARLSEPGAETLHCDLVTCSFGLHAIPEEAQPSCLAGIAALLAPGGQFVATVWDDMPMVALGQRCLAAATGATSHPAALSPTSMGNGRADAMLAAAGLAPVAGHNECGEVVLRLGRRGEERTWMLGLLPSMGALADAAHAEGADGAVFERARAAFEREAAALSTSSPHGATAESDDDDGECVELRCKFRLLSAVKQRLLA